MCNKRHKTPNNFLLADNYLEILFPFGDLKGRYMPSMHAVYVPTAEMAGCGCAPPRLGNIPTTRK
jgi:hypothetical protein